MTRPNPMTQPTEPIQRPYDSCGDCPYVAHGFQCNRKEGDCIKTRIEKITRKKAPI